MSYSEICYIMHPYATYISRTFNFKGLLKFDFFICSAKSQSADHEIHWLSVDLIDQESVILIQATNTQLLCKSVSRTRPCLTWRGRAIRASADQSRLHTRTATQSPTCSSTRSYRTSSKTWPWDSQPRVRAEFLFVYFPCHFFSAHIIRTRIVNLTMGHNGQLVRAIAL